MVLTWCRRTGRGCPSSGWLPPLVASTWRGTRAHVSTRGRPLVSRRMAFKADFVCFGARTEGLRGGVRGVKQTESTESPECPPSGSMPPSPPEPHVPVQHAGSGRDRARQDVGILVRDFEGEHGADGHACDVEAPVVEAKARLRVAQEPFNTRVQRRPGSVSFASPHVRPAPCGPSVRAVKQTKTIIHGNCPS